MATSKQTQAAGRNVKKAQKAAADQKTIAHLSAGTRTALGKQGAAVGGARQTWITPSSIMPRPPSPVPARLR